MALAHEQTFRAWYGIQNENFCTQRHMYLEQAPFHATRYTQICIEANRVGRETRMDRASLNLSSELGVCATRIERSCLYVATKNTHENTLALAANTCT